MKYRIVILQDYISEAVRIQRVNNWMTYAHPIHRIREFGINQKCFDHLSERLLTHIEMRDACIFLLGYDSILGILDPVSDWPGFMESLEDSMDTQSSVWGQFRPIINIRRLKKAYGPQRRYCSCYWRLLKSLDK